MPSTQTKDLWSTTKLKPPVLDFLALLSSIACIVSGAIFTVEDDKLGSNDIGGVAGYVLFFPILSLIISILNLTLWFGKFKAAQLHPGWTLFVCIVQIGLSGLSLAIASFYDWFIVDAYGYGRGRGSEKYGRPWLACIGALEAVLVIYFVVSCIGVRRYRKRSLAAATAPHRSRVETTDDVELEAPPAYSVAPK